MDLHSVPRNHLRFISWIAYVVTKDPRNGLRESIVTLNSPHNNYYIQDGIDMGAMMDTDIKTQGVFIFVFIRIDLYLFDILIQPTNNSIN